MKSLKQLFTNNRNWAERVSQNNPQFFINQASQQKPEYLWIGCSDSRVPSSQIVDLMPGEIFVHRNIANLVNLNDLNCLSVIQFAVDVLKVKHIMVVGHYDCDGVKASLDGINHNMVDNWLQQLKDIYQCYNAELDLLEDSAQFNRLCELSVIEQVANVCNTSTIKQAWQRGQDVHIHGWIFSVSDGLLTDLDVTTGITQWRQDNR